MTITYDQLNEWKELCEKATEGKWHANSACGDPECCGEVVIRNNERIIICTLNDRDDGNFIADSRTAMPELIAEVEELQKYVEELQGDNKKLRSILNAHGLQIKIDRSKIK